MERTKPTPTAELGNREGTCSLAFESVPAHMLEFTWQHLAPCDLLI